VAVATRLRARHAARVRPKGDAHPRWERRLTREGFRAIAGLDEAGRGSLAGPLVAAGVVLPRPTRGLLQSLRGLRDSKQLSIAERERLFEVIRSVAITTSVGLVTAASVDLLGLTAAGFLALERAARALNPPPDYLLIDAFALPRPDCPQEAIIFGDAICVSIAAASVIAKVERDALLTGLARRYPGFGFEHNKGYSTDEHVAALAKLGPTPEHRVSYAPVRAVLEGVSPSPFGRGVCPEPVDELAEGACPELAEGPE
jgi:ribonuclease HII